jgi:ribosome biogenesis GTPase
VRRIACGAEIVPLAARVDAGPIAARVRNVTSVLLGSSGAGKSTIVNGLLGESTQATGEVRSGDDRGRHTTTARMLLALPGGGAIIDTPGLRELQLWASEESLESAFAEIAEIAQACRFGDCSHSGEPDCAIAAALANGVLEEDRWRSYLKLRNETKRHLLERDALARAQEKQRLRAVFREHKRIVQTKELFRRGGGRYDAHSSS